MQGCNKIIGILFVSILALSSQILWGATALERPILQVKTVPMAPKVGQGVSIFVQTETDFFEKDLLLSGLLGAAPVKLSKTGENLWVASFEPFSEIATHQLNLNLHLRDTKEAKRIEKAIGELKQEIAELEEKIAQEQNEEQRLILEEIRDEKLAFQSELETSLENLKTYLKTESFTFSIAADPSNSNFPQISTLVPAVLPLDRRTRVTISGSNFPLNPNVKISGETATIISASASQIVILSPRLQSLGAKNVEIIFPQQGGDPAKNAISTNSLFVTNQTVLTNLRPVAVTRGYQKVDWPIAGPAVLDAAQSYDENGNDLSFEWILRAAPNNSVLIPGLVLANSATPSLAVDKKGIYRVELRVKETATEELLTSLISTVTIEVK